MRKSKNISVNFMVNATHIPSGIHVNCGKMEKNQNVTEPWQKNIIEERKLWDYLQPSLKCAKIRKRTSRIPLSGKVFSKIWDIKSLYWKTCFFASSPSCLKQWKGKCNFTQTNLTRFLWEDNKSCQWGRVRYARGMLVQQLLSRKRHNTRTHSRAYGHLPVSVSFLFDHDHITRIVNILWVIGHTIKKQFAVFMLPCAPLSVHAHNFTNFQ